LGLRPARWLIEIEDGTRVLVAGRYRLDAVIGRGGMGEVWRASDEVLGRPVAVKLLLGGGSDEEATARFRLEAQTAARLNDPHVVTVFDFGSWDGRFFLVMELVEGSSLAQDLAAGAGFSPQRVAGIAAQAAAGLAAAHGQGVVHRDIKPGNLMQDALGAVKIGDFGIARFVDDASAALTSAGQIVGTSLYLAPERALGTPAGPGSDVYALGCVLYQLLAGEPPFQADTAAAVLHLHVEAPPPSASLRCPQLPGAFEQYLLRMLAKRPEDRPSAQEVAHWFAGAAWRGGAQETYTLPPTTVQPSAANLRRGAPRGRQRVASRAQTRVRIRAHLRRHKMLTTVTAGVTAFVAAALLSAAWSSGDSGPQHPDAGPSQTARTSSTSPASPAPAASPSGIPATVPAHAQGKGHGEDGKKHRKG
jgi:serine/threonine-protein kinase